MSRGRAAAFQSLIKAGTSVKSYVLSQLKNEFHEFHKVQIFSTFRVNCARLRGNKSLRRMFFNVLLNGESTCDLKIVPDSNHDRKTTSRRFETIHDLVRSLRLAQSIVKGQNAHREAMG